jgi:hypothetical protein
VLPISKNITNLITIIKSIDFVLQSHISRKKSKPSTFHPLNRSSLKRPKPSETRKNKSSHLSLINNSSFALRKKRKKTTYEQLAEIIFFNLGKGGKREYIQFRLNNSAGVLLT